MQYIFNTFMLIIGIISLVLTITFFVKIAKYFNKKTNNDEGKIM